MSGGNISFTVPSTAMTSRGVTMSSSNRSSMIPSNATISLGATIMGGSGSLLSPLNVLPSSSCTRQSFIVGELKTNSRRTRGFKQLHKQFLGIPLRMLQSPLKLDDLASEQKRQYKGQSFNMFVGNGVQQMMLRNQQTTSFLPGNIQFNPTVSSIGKGSNLQNRLQCQCQSPIRDKDIILAPIYKWREGMFFVRCSAFVAMITVLGVLFLYGQARAQAYIDERILPSVATVMGNYLGRKINLGKVQRVSPLGLTLESCSMGPHAEEFSCGELPKVKLRIRPLASLQRGEIVVDAVLLQPHFLIAQKENWTWLGIPTPTEKPLGKHSSNEEGIDGRTKARRLAREQTSICWAKERNEAARKWALVGYKFEDSEIKSPGKDDELHAEAMVNCDPMNCIDEDVTTEQGFDGIKAGREDHMHHKCTEGVCSKSGMEFSELDKVFRHDGLDGSFNFRDPVSELKIWLKENMLRPIKSHFRRKNRKIASLSQKATLQRRNLDQSAAAARMYFEKRDRGQSSNVEEGGGYIGNSGASSNPQVVSYFERARENSQEHMLPDEDGECGRYIANNMAQKDSWQTNGNQFANSVVNVKKDLTKSVKMYRKDHIVTGFEHPSFETDVGCSRGLEDVILVDKGAASTEHEASSESECSKHLSTHCRDNAKSSVYEALVQAINDCCQTTENSTSCESFSETRTDERVFIKCKASKGYVQNSDSIDRLLLNSAEGLSSNHLGDTDVASIGMQSPRCENSLLSPHGKVAVNSAFKEREENWSQNNENHGSSSFLVSLRSSGETTQAKPSSLIYRSTELPFFHGSMMMVLDYFITFMQRMEEYLRTKFEQLATEFAAGAQERVQIAGSQKLFPVALDSVYFRGGTLMLLGYGDQEPRCASLSFVDSLRQHGAFGLFRAPCLPLAVLDLHLFFAYSRFN
eukprot:Gb_34395 [translate_table: standard]